MCQSVLCTCPLCSLPNTPYSDRLPSQQELLTLKPIQYCSKNMRENTLVQGLEK